MNEDQEIKVIADPHRLEELGIPTADLIGLASVLNLSKRSVREIIDTKFREIRYVDRRKEGIPTVNTRLYAIDDVASFRERFLAFREVRRKEGIERDQAAVTKAREEKAQRQAKQGKPKGAPAPKPVSAPKPKPQGPRELPPMLSRARGRAPAPVVEVLRRVAR